MGKVRIYDLAKELKLESKKVLEDARRMGVDVSVPSNTLDDNIAAKIREMYYPKKEQTTAPRTARLIKHHPSAAPATAPETVEEAPAPLTPEIKEQPAPISVPTVTPQPVIHAKAQPAVKVTPAPEEAKPQVAVNETAKPKIVKLPSPPPAATKPEPAPEREPLPIQAEVEQIPPKQVVAEPAAVPPLKEVEPEPIAAKIPVPVIQKKPSKPEVVTAPASSVGVSTEARSTGTKVIKLTPPTRPMPKPAPKLEPKPVQKTGPAPFEKPAAKSQGALPAKPRFREAQRETPARPQLRESQRETRDKEVHILPSGAQQRTVYIPPKDQRSEEHTSELQSR